jgi:L-ascorbate metabolism protein UlaG (beta-lactamase superfamily)
MLGEGYKVLFQKNLRTEPIDSLPSIKTNLKTLPADSNLIVWFGHSSALLQVDGKKILIDPVFSGHASPLPWGVKSYKGSDVYSANDMPDIDYLIISHDHYDHLDYETVLALKNKIKYVVCGLGGGAHFEHWGYPSEKIIEKDWYEKVELEKGITIHTLPSHHDSGRGFTRAQALWLSFLIETPTMKIYYSGDGGYDSRFKEIGEKFGPIDLAIMEAGQYDLAWQSVHELPHEIVQATKELKAKRMLPVHHSKFTLGKHPWDEPLVKLTELTKNTNTKLMTPLIGEVIYIKETNQVFKQWWLGIK